MITLANTNFNSKKLGAAVERINKAVKNSFKAYYTIGKELGDIRDKKTYKEDFETFEAFCKNVFQMSRASAYRIISVTNKFLLPENNGEKDLFFSEFEDTALALMLPLGDYDTTKEIVINAEITPEMPVKAIKQALKEATQPDESNSTETGDESENTETGDENENAETVTDSDIGAKWTEIVDRMNNLIVNRNSISRQKKQSEKKKIGNMILELIDNI